MEHFECTMLAVDLRKKDQSEKLSDKTRIGKMTWAELKEYAMKENYKQQSWFAPLKTAEKELLLSLISA